MAQSVDIKRATLAFDEKAPTRLSRVLTFMWRLRLGVIGAAFVLVLLATAIFCPLLAPNDPLEQDILNSLLPPAWMATLPARMGALTG